MDGEDAGDEGHTEGEKTDTNLSQTLENGTEVTKKAWVKGRVFFYCGAQDRSSSTTGTQSNSPKSSSRSSYSSSSSSKSASLAHDPQLLSPWCLSGWWCYPDDFSPFTRRVCDSQGSRSDRRNSLYFCELRKPFWLAPLKLSEPVSDSILIRTAEEMVAQVEEKWTEWNSSAHSQAAPPSSSASHQPRKKRRKPFQMHIAVLCKQNSKDGNYTWVEESRGFVVGTTWPRT